MHPRNLRSMLAVSLAVLCAAQLPLMAKAASAPRFHLEEATIADVQRAIRAKEITAEQIVQLYFKRIEAHNGRCVNGQVDSAGLMLGEITPIENAGQVNAYMTLNIRGKRSKTDSADNDPKMLDALETEPRRKCSFRHKREVRGVEHRRTDAEHDDFRAKASRTHGTLSQIFGMVCSWYSESIRFRAANLRSET